MQDANIEPSGPGWRKASSNIFRDVPLSKAAAVNHNAEVREFYAFDLAGGKLVHAIGQGQSARDLACRIMVAADEEEADARADESRSLADEELAGRIVLPVAVVEIAGNDDKCHVRVDRCVD
jgi:hypothetical protein